MPDQEDLREAVRRRILWFYETQLRELNCEMFRGVEPGSANPLLDLVAENAYTTSFQNRFGRLEDAPRTYRDSERPIWTASERGYRDAFAASLLGRVGDWLDHREPRKLGERLAEISEEFHASRFGSVWEDTHLGQFPRLHLDDKSARAISRAELAAARPWLIPELYSQPHEAPTEIGAWISALERYVSEFESELALSVGGIAGTALPFDLPAPQTYRALLAGMLAASSAHPVSRAVKVGLLRLAKGDEAKQEAQYQYEPTIRTGGAPGTKPAEGGRTAYWAKVFEGPLKECVALKANSDMGLCQLVRILYRYGTLPDALMQGGEPRWRSRSEPDETYDRFMAARRAEITDGSLLARFNTAEARLRIVLEESARFPRSPDPSFSPLAGEILKHGLLSYKFWLDEQPRALRNERLNKVKTALVGGESQDAEMEFWSENHYIMYASCEYLLGQLWEQDEFQPCRVFADPADTTGRITGARRRERGRARVLKWLNNRLMFGWMEFNSSGYYREHLWAILNLVDFALDEEVRTKAEMAVDLMLFDVVRNLHRGSMGAAGGRSQFKSKSSGFDNGLTDVVEILLGAKGVFVERNADVAAAFASSEYETPLALLEMGAHPPEFAFTDRSRVSVTFDEAAKYGIRYSQDTESRRAWFRGYATKRARYSPHLEEVNREIERTHNGYDSRDDDIVFFWGMSAFVNKQVVSGTFRMRQAYGLAGCDAFKAPLMLIELGSLYKSPADLLDLPGDVVDAITGAAGDTVNEETADELSVLIEGSTRTRANIVTHHSPGAMLSSLQNFRCGQLNFQSSVQQATMGGALNVFVNAGFGGLDISDLAAFGAGFLLAGVEGGVGGVIAKNAVIQDTNPLCDDHVDGPDWWTGNWALPRILQHGGAAIMLSDFHAIQEFLAETGSHVWFPGTGFDKVVERRTSAYDDANFALSDIGHIGAKGFWLFGKLRHPSPAAATAESEEGYVGVFSNRRPEWLTMESDPYDHYIKEQSAERPDGLPDVFSGKDWYVNGNNVWIVQVGSRSEFGSFESFMDRVSSARVRIDDAGDLECTFDSPAPGGGSARLRVTNGDVPEFEVNGRPAHTDLFPRFENPFVRGGVVEWQQRAYCLEWNGQSLLHDFTDSLHPVRGERPLILPADATTIVALVIHLRTGHEELEADDLVVAAVDIGCVVATKDQVVAVGPVGEDTRHDAEWIYLDGPVQRNPDMTLSLTQIHGDSDWEAGFTLKALMGDHRIRDCTFAFQNLQFDDDRRSTGPRAFAVRMSEWERWQPVTGTAMARSWRLAAQPPLTTVRNDHTDLLLLDRGGRLWHRRVGCGGTVGFWRELGPSAQEPDFTTPFSWAVVNDGLGTTSVLVVNQGRCLARLSDHLGHFKDPWLDVGPMTKGLLSMLPDRSVPLGLGSTVTAVAGFFGAEPDLYLTGSDGAVFMQDAWSSGRSKLWKRLSTPGFDVMPGVAVGVASAQLVALSDEGTLWAKDLREYLLGGPSGWQELPSPGFTVMGFAVTGSDALVRLAALGRAGQVAVGEHTPAGLVRWREIAVADGWRPALFRDPVWAEPEPGKAWVFCTGQDGTVRGALADDWVWRPVGSGDPPGRVSALAVTCRTAGQVELFGELADGSLAWTWWS